MVIKYYVDSCIYLDIIQNDEKFSEKSRKFLKKTSKCKVLYSGYVLKEIDHISGKDNREYFKRNKNFIRVWASDEIIAEARAIERKINFKISFYDIIHMLISKNEDAILVTRDKELLKLAKNYGCKAMTPENVSNC